MRRLALILAPALLLSCGVPGSGGRSLQAGAGATGAAAARTGSWYAVQLHAHSTHSDGVFPVPRLIAMAKQEGLDALGLSEHDTTTQWSDPAFLAEKELVMLHSEEARDDRSRNHMGLHGMTGTAPIVMLPRDEGLTEAARRDATIIANHPLNRFVPWKPLTWDPRVHAIEVWNGWFLNPVAPEAGGSPHGISHNESAIRWWAGLLAGGVRVAPIAASDFHRRPQNLASPCTLVFAQERSETAILAGIRAGRTVLVEHPRRQRLELTADAAGEGSFGAMVGDTVPRTARFRIQARRAKGDVLRLMAGGREIYRTKVDSPDWQRDLALGAGAGTERFVYARLDAEFAIRRMQAMTAAIYLTND